MLFEVYLVRKGWISPAQLINAIEAQARSHTPLGQLAIEQRKLTMKQLFHVIAAQAETDQPFGKVAVELGYLKEADVAQLLMLQRDSVPSIGAFLVRQGAIQEATLQAEMQQFHRHMANQAEPGDPAIATPVMAAPYLPPQLVQV
jgi:hypothetical protein